MWAVSLGVASPNFISLNTLVLVVVLMTYWSTGVVCGGCLNVMVLVIVSIEVEIYARTTSILL